MSATPILFPAGPGYLSIDRRRDGGDLLVAHRRARSRGHAPVLADVPRHARRPFRLTGVDAKLPIE